MCKVSNAGIGIKKGGSSSSLYVTPAKVSPVVPSICIHNLATTQAKPFKITIPLTSSQESQDANSQLTHLLIGVGTTPFTCRSHGNDSLIKTAVFVATLDLLVKQYHVVGLMVVINRFLYIYIYILQKGSLG